MILKHTRLSFMFFYCYINETLVKLKKFATLLPNNWLAKSLQAFALKRLGSVRGKEADFLK
jgi:Flp pilus assembly protein TadD